MVAFFLPFEKVPDYADSGDRVYFEQSDGQPYDWAGCDFVLNIGAERNGGTPLVTLTQAAGEIVPGVDVDGSYIDFHWSAAKLQALLGRSYPLDMNNLVGGVPNAWAIGSIDILQGVGA